MPSHSKEKQREYDRVRKEKLKNNPELHEKRKAKIREWQQRTWNRPDQVARRKKRDKVRYKEDVVNLKSNRYIKERLRRDGFKKEQITEDIIEIKRLIIKTKRL